MDCGATSIFDGICYPLHCNWWSLFLTECHCETCTTTKSPFTHQVHHIHNLQHILTLASINSLKHDITSQYSIVKQTPHGPTAPQELSTGTAPHAAPLELPPMLSLWNCPSWNNCLDPGLNLLLHRRESRCLPLHLPLPSPTHPPLDAAQCALLRTLYKMLLHSAAAATQNREMDAV